ncbi:elongation factor 4, partial [Bacillus paralicheniformis]|nr:elongation factor 4 [Bacillus paralicheniformis]
NIELIATARTVIYYVYMTDGEKIVIENPSNMPDPKKMGRVEEAFVKATMMVTNDFVGAVMELCQGKRGQFID